MINDQTLNDLVVEKQKEYPNLTITLDKSIKELKHDRVFNTFLNTLEKAYSVITLYLVESSVHIEHDDLNGNHSRVVFIK